ncbi:matrix metalloproteinase-20 [Polymixia lowei]
MELFWSWIPVLGSLMFLDILWTLPIDQEQRLRPEDIELAEGYLRRFYNLNHKVRASDPGRMTRSTSTMEEKIRDMQEFFGLEQSGGLDPDTLAVMRETRCGVPDVENFSFYPERPKWNKETITYTIKKPTPDLKRKDVENSFRSALKIWSDMVPLTFLRVNHDKADIVFSFTRRTHGDFFPFDGPKGVLAHAFEPGEGMGGDVHFDEDETWTIGKQNKGYNLFTVAAHELGHSLGLSHSRDPSSLMYPNYKYLDSAHYTLPNDDVIGIQTLYGKLIDPTIPQKCDHDFSVDAVAVIDTELVFFKDRYMWMRTTWTTYWNQLREGHSSTYLPSINSHVDAAYDIPAKGVAYIFTGHKYWVVQQLKMKSHAGSIYEYGFSTGVERIDAAVHISEYGKTFFFIGEVYYSYDEGRRRMDPGPPKVIQVDWAGKVRRIDAAFQLHGNIFLFSGTKTYQYDFRQNRVLNTIPANAWLGC